MPGRNDGEAVGGSELRALALMVLAAVAIVVPLQAFCAPAPIIRATLYPALAADGITLVLIGATVFLAWSAWRTHSRGAQGRGLRPR